MNSATRLLRFDSLDLVRDLTLNSKFARRFYQVRQSCHLVLEPPIFFFFFFFFFSGRFEFIQFFDYFDNFLTTFLTTFDNFFDNFLTTFSTFLTIF
jgi:hypothetical protein